MTAIMKRFTVILALLGLLVVCLAASSDAAAADSSVNSNWQKLRLHRRNAVKAVAKPTNEDSETRKLLDAFVDGVFEEVEKLAKAGSEAASTLKEEIEKIGSSVGTAASKMHESTKMIEYKPAKADEKLAVAVPLPAHEVEVPAKKVEASPKKEAVEMDESDNDTSSGLFDDWMPSFSFCGDEGDCFDFDDDDVLILGRSSPSFPVNSTPILTFVFIVLVFAFFVVPFGTAMIASHIHKKRMQRAGYMNVAVAEGGVFGASSPVWTESDQKIPAMV
jgi:hypothetical protein